MEIGGVGPHTPWNMPTEGAREMYFPARRWVDYWDDSLVVEGPSPLTVDAPLDVIPVFVRGEARVARP